MKNRKDKIDIFLEEIVESIDDVREKEYWPLNPTQIVSYYESDILLDFYYSFLKLKKEGRNLQHISDKMARSGVLIDFLLDFAAIGFKVLNNFKIKNISFKEREIFFKEIIRIIEYKIKQVTNNLKKELEQRKNDFTKLSDGEKAKISKFKVALFGFNWSLFYDKFARFGYDCQKLQKVRRGNVEYLLFVEEYYNLKPAEIWPACKNIKIKNVKIHNFYKPFDYKNTLYNYSRLKTKENLNSKLEAIEIFIDGKKENDFRKISRLTDQIFELTARQTEFVESLSDLEKVDKAILMTYWMHKELLGSKWKEMYGQARKNIDIFGKKFLKLTLKSNNRSKKELKRMFDPRNNYF